MDNGQWDHLKKKLPLMTREETREFLEIKPENEEHLKKRTVEKVIPLKDVLTEGQKFDDTKLRWTLFDFRALEETLKVLEHGARKYSPDNWKKVTPLKDRYTNALLRHLIAWMHGEKDDPDSGLSHLAHLNCNAHFLLANEIGENK